MVPYADLINHSPYSAAYVDAQQGEKMLPWSKPDEDEVVLYADRAYKKVSAPAPARMCASMSRI